VGQARLQGREGERKAVRDEKAMNTGAEEGGGGVRMKDRKLGG